MLGETQLPGRQGAKSCVTLGPVGREPGADFTDLGLGRRLHGIAVAPLPKGGPHLAWAALKKKRCLLASMKCNSSMCVS
jgi:hypothetical protein